MPCLKLLILCLLRLVRYTHEPQDWFHLAKIFVSKIYNKQIEQKFKYREVKI